jgi:methionyl-tRNA synthetase
MTTPSAAHEGARQKNQESGAAPRIPKRAVVTGGMPYGNKDLHFGHVGGMFVQADAFARFLRDRIGRENVLFVSGTDCYGSPVVEYHRQACARGEWQGDLESFVAHNHELQKDVLKQFDISLDLFAASGLGPSKSIHRELCQDVLRQLYSNGHLIKMSSLQFYDPQAGVLLNGRQVIGRCPVPGCSSERGYADECALGHPYEPKELIAPRSALSGEVPELREVENWYLDLPKFHGLLSAWIDELAKLEGYRPFVVSGIREFLEPPAIYLKAELQESLEGLRAQLPPFQHDINRNQALRVVFNSLADREAACRVLREANLRFRTGKTLVPFRLTGNVAWGVPAPDLEGPGSAKDSTFWVWPESLIAPLSFCTHVLQERDPKQSSTAGAAPDWQRWWADADSVAYQFIGEDNLYFYSLAEMGIFLGMQGHHPTWPPAKGHLQPPHLVVNNHILYFDKKASSSGDLKPPLARQLLDHYTSDQLRAHFLALALGQKSVGFKPKSFNPSAGPKDADPVLKDGNLLCNAFNKSVRTAFYTMQKATNLTIPDQDVSQSIKDSCRVVVARYEDLVMRQVFHEVMALLDTAIRDINKHWTQSVRSTELNLNDDPNLRQAFVDNLHLIRTATVLLHPIAPRGTELIRQYLGFDDSFWDWQSIHDPLQALARRRGHFNVQELPPRFDFFPKHPSQFATP